MIEYRCRCDQCVLHKDIVHKVCEIANRYLPPLAKAEMPIEDRQFMFDIFELAKLLQ